MAVKKPSLCDKHAETLRTWRTLEEAVMQCDEPTLKELLEAEKQGKGRRLFLQRIFGRYTMVRAARETRELKAAIKDV